MKLQAKYYRVLRPFDSVQVGTVAARNSLSAQSQADLMFGKGLKVEVVAPPTTIAGLARYPQVASTPKEPQNPAFGPGQKAAFTKQLLALAA